MVSAKLELRIILRIISFVIFSFTINDISGQNWIPFNPRNTGNYSTSALFQDIAVIKSDSFKIVNSDTVFYLNTILAGYTIPPYNDPIVLPQFLMKTMRNIDNEWYVFKDTSTFVFKIRSSPGDSWVYDSTNNIIATVSGIKYDTVLGRPDSLKYIALSSLDTIIISKNFGIISMDVSNSDLKYKLIGIENLNVGYKVPSYPDFFDFNVGDVFEYREVNQYNGQSVSQRGGTTICYKINILEKTQIANGFKYHVEKSMIDSSWAFGIPLEITYNKSFEDQLYTYDSVSVLNYYNNQRFSKYGVTRLYFSYDTFFNVNVKKYDAVPFPDQESATYGEGIGLINYYEYHYDNYGGDNQVYKYLIACKKGDRVYGTIHPDWFYTGISDQNREEELVVFPNPAIDFLFIQTNFHSGFDSFSIYDVNGKYIFSEQLINGLNSIDITKLRQGHYVIKILAKEKVWIKSFIKL